MWLAWERNDDPHSTATATATATVGRLPSVGHRHLVKNCVTGPADPPGSREWSQPAAVSTMRLRSVTRG